MIAFVIRRTLLLIIAMMLVSGCFFFKDDDEGPTASGAQQLYDRARESLDNGDFNNAIVYYEALEARFPFSNLARQGQIDLIYAYYRNRQPESVIDAAQQFVRENPTHPRVDYTLYMRGMALFAGESSFYHRWLNIDLSMRPPKDAQDSFAAFAELVRRFPDSRYAVDARQRMVFLRNRLAEHENHIAGFYLERGAYAAALSRASYTIETYDGAPTTSETLAIMVAAYEGLGLTELADDTQRVLAASYPEEMYTTPAVLKEPWYKFWTWF